MLIIIGDKGLALFDFKKFTEAIVESDKALRLDPNHSIAVTRFGSNCNALSDSTIASLNVLS